MRAIDTNVLIRFLTNDDRDQAARARQLIADGDIFIATTVLLETEWVLRSLYRLATADVLLKLRAIAGLPGVTVEQAAIVTTALHWAEAGLDFADALHLALSSGCDVFMSFDRSLQRASAGLSDVPVLEP